VGTLEDLIDRNRLSVRVFGGTLTIFALIALLLAAIGLSAVLAHAVSHRRREIGVRMAMGGTGRDILGLVFAQGMRPLALGLAVGLVAASLLTRVLQSMPSGVKPGDPLTYAVVVMVLLLAGQCLRLDSSGHRTKAKTGTVPVFNSSVMH
jgi:ABC-type antimicrobial peptide transport system permease subunit